MTPPHAYVPGATPRHPEGLFDAIRETVSEAMSPAQLAASEAWSTGLRYYREGYFWECHEVVEPVWMSAPDASPERAMAQAVIQLANAALKARMGKPRAVRRLCAMAEAHLAEARGGGPAVLGLSADWVAGEISALRLRAENVQYNANLTIGGV